MLRVVHGNRAEVLLDAMLAAIPPLDPFEPTPIVAGSHLIARWVTREIAFSRGIASGLDIITFDRFVERTWTDGTELAALDRRQLAAAIASVLADGDVVRRLPAVRAYLDAAPDAGDRAGPRRVQLADHLAHLAWSYAMTRPDWMPAFAAARVPEELAPLGDAARWQAALIGEALARSGMSPTPMLPWARRRAGLGAPRLATPVAVFGMSFLARSQLEALSDLAVTTDVTVFFLDPCRELWDDVPGRGGIAEARSVDDQPLPLVLWGKPVNHTIAAFIERDAELDDAFVDDQDPASARQQLVADVLVRAPPTAQFQTAGIVVHACPNARREIEVVADEARRRLDADPTLRAHEIAVWIAGDVRGYLAQAPAAFDAVGVPCHLVDAPVDDRGRIGEAVLSLLDLPTSPMTRKDLLRVMTHPAVIARFPHATAADWVAWTEQLGIAHGADATAHAGTYLEEHVGSFHWDQGVRRLALGAFMVGGERSGRGPASLPEPRTQAIIEVAPEEVPPDLQASAATYALLVRSLCADAAWLGSHVAPLAEWAELFVGLVDAYLAPITADSELELARDVERARKMLAGLAHLDLDGRAVGFREARQHAIHAFASARSNRGEPLASGVMVAPLLANRGVPARVTFVVGLDAGEFPAGEHASPLDLRAQNARRGDVSERDRDRAAFLELLLGVRDALHLSYVAVEPKSGQPLNPSSVILELADALAPYLGAETSKQALARLTVTHPLHRFDEHAPRHAREPWAVEVRDRVRWHLRSQGYAIPDEDGMQHLLETPPQAALRTDLGLERPPTTTARVARTRPLSIANLRAFLEYPVQAWAQAVLGLDELPDDAAVEASDEPFQLDRAERAVLLREVFASHLQEEKIGGMAQRYDEAVHDLALRGQFPVGVFGEAARVLDLAVLENWRACLGPLAIDSAVRYAFGRASHHSAREPRLVLHPAIELHLSGGRVVQLVGQTELLVRNAGLHTSIVPMIRELKPKSPYHLRGAFDHLVIAAAGLVREGHAHQLVDRNGKDCLVRHGAWTPSSAHDYLAGLVEELLDHPHGYLLPWDSLVNALRTGKQPGRVYGDLTGGLGYGPIKRRDGLAAPPDAVQIARRRLGPIVSHLISGNHGFEVAR